MDKPREREMRDTQNEREDERDRDHSKTTLKIVRREDVQYGFSRYKWQPRASTI